VLEKGVVNKKESCRRKLNIWRHSNRSVPVTVVMIVDIRTTSEIRDAFYDGFFAELYDSFVRGDINENEAYEILG
jgi:hypothetical protein